MRFQICLLLTRDQTRWDTETQCPNLKLAAVFRSNDANNKFEPSHLREASEGLLEKHRCQRRAKTFGGRDETDTAPATFRWLAAEERRASPRYLYLHKKRWKRVLANCCPRRRRRLRNMLHDRTFFVIISRDNDIRGVLKKYRDCVYNFRGNKDNETPTMASNKVISKLLVLNR